MALAHLENVEELYELQDKLGSGHFSTIWRCRKRSTGIFYASKFIKLRRRKGSRLGIERKVVEREVTILQQLQHPHIIRLHDVFICQVQMVLVLELIQGGEFFDFVAEKESMAEPEASEFLLQLLDGLVYIHSLNIAHFDLKEHLEDLTIYREYFFHLDSTPDIFHDSHKHFCWYPSQRAPNCCSDGRIKFIKPENIMIQQKDVIKPNIKIIGFGMAQKIEKNTRHCYQFGIPDYIGIPIWDLPGLNSPAPEVINLEPLTVVADMWSVGVITYILISGISPFQGETENATVNNIMKGTFEYEDTFFSSTSTIAKDFISQLLVIKPKERMTSTQALLHPWIKPLTIRQERNRECSSINISNFRKFNSQRKWKLSCRLINSCCKNFCEIAMLSSQIREEEEMRSCESDQEESTMPSASLLRRRHSSFS